MATSPLVIRELFFLVKYTIGTGQICLETSILSLVVVKLVDLGSIEGTKLSTPERDKIIDIFQKLLFNFRDMAVNDVRGVEVLLLVRANATGCDAGIVRHLECLLENVGVHGGIC